MEWRLRVRLDRIYAPERKHMASRNWWHSLFARHAFPYVGAPAFSERDLARVCAAGSKLSLFGDPCFLSVGIGVSCGPRGPDHSIGRGHAAAARQALAAAKDSPSGDINPVVCIGE